MQQELGSAIAALCSCLSTKPADLGMAISTPPGVLAVGMIYLLAASHEDLSSSSHQLLPFHGPGHGLSPEEGRLPVGLVLLTVFHLTPVTFPSVACLCLPGDRRVLSWLPCESL